MGIGLEDNCYNVYTDILINDVNIETSFNHPEADSTPTTMSDFVQVQEWPTLLNDSQRRPSD